MFCLKTVSEDFVLKELNSLNITKSIGVDNLPARFLKDGASFLKINDFQKNKKQIHCQKQVPVELKSARVKALYEKNSQTDVGNYRPFSILCIVSKIIERAVYNQLEHFK